jgi:hypothetical protein
MRPQSEIEDLRNTLGALVDLHRAELPTDMIAAVHNALCFILDDGSPHAAAFERNYKRLMGWCESKGITIIRTPPVEGTQ